MLAADLAVSAGILVSGTVMVLVIAAMDRQCVAGLHGNVHQFVHPFFQTWLSNVGNVSCLLCYLLLRLYFRLSANREADTGAKGVDASPDFAANYLREYSPVTILYYLVPALLDVTRSVLMLAALALMAPSVMQMLKGTVVIFTALLGTVFLRHRLRLHHYVGICFVVVGAMLVGLSSCCDEDVEDEEGESCRLLGANQVEQRPLLGLTFVLISQLLNAAQMTIEERLLKKYQTPLVYSLGAEGLWGILVISVVLVITSFLPGPLPDLPLDSALDALLQLQNSWWLSLGALVSMSSVAIHGLFAFALMRRQSATPRALVDISKSLLVWLCALFIGWERFDWQQLVGFLVLVCGTLVYLELLPLPLQMACERHLPHCCNVDEESQREAPPDATALEATELTHLLPQKTPLPVATDA